MARDLRKAGLCHVFAGEEATIPADGMLNRCGDTPDRLPAEVTGRPVAVEREEMRFFDFVVPAMLPARAFAPAPDQMLTQIGNRRRFGVAGAHVPGLELSR